MAYTWSKRAREDFKEREAYRKAHGEIDRYRKRGESSDESYASSLVDLGFGADEARPWEGDSWDLNGELSALTAENDADPSAANRIKAAFAYMNNQLDSYDADFDDLMAGYQRLKDYSIKSLLSQSTPTQGETTTSIVEETEDTRPKTFDDLWEG